jgi:hypothetical protein
VEGAAGKKSNRKEKRRLAARGKHKNRQNQPGPQKMLTQK